MSKTVAFGAAPRPRQKAQPDTQAEAERWVENRTSERIKRLTIDIPASLHRRIKISCAMRDTPIAEEIRGLLEKHFQSDP